LVNSFLSDCAECFVAQVTKANFFVRFYSLAINIISGCWILFLFVWVLTAPSAKRSIYRETGADRVRYWL
jgi:hypothetical protein